MYSEELNFNFVQLTVKLNQINKDASGLTLGLLEADHIDYSNTNSHAIAVNGKGFTHKYNVIENYNYTFKTNDKVTLL